MGGEPDEENGRPKYKTTLLSGHEAEEWGWGVHLVCRCGGPSCGSPFSFLCEGRDRPSFEKEKGVDYDVWEKQRRFKNGLDNGEVDR